MRDQSTSALVQNDLAVVEPRERRAIYVLTTHVDNTYSPGVGGVQRGVLRRRSRNATEAAFVGLLVVAEQAHQRLEEMCRRHGITHAQYNVLRILRGVYPEGHPRFEITNRLIRRAPDVTRLLDRLERQGLIEREWDRGNRRQSIARITDRGLSLLQAIEPELRTLHDDILGPLTREQVESLAAALDQLNR
jgi:DNA-binding MarR family transcriptional regulator